MEMESNPAWPKEKESSVLKIEDVSYINHSWNRTYNITWCNSG